MDIVLQKHKAKQILNVPDGLDELSADIGREVIRNQPENVYEFVCNYLEALIITRENVFVAVKVVEDITIKSEEILEVLDRLKLTNKQISAVLPPLQQAFRDYVKAYDRNLLFGNDGEEADCECESLMWIRRIFRESGSCFGEAKKASLSIQALFSEHLKSLRELHEIQSRQTAGITTSDILLKIGVSRSEASMAALKIQSAYRGYCVRKNLSSKEKKLKKVDQIDNLEIWLEKIYQRRGLNRVHEYAKVIQDAWRKFAQTRPNKIPEKSKSQTSSAANISLETNSEDLVLFDQQRVSNIGFNTVVKIAKDSFFEDSTDSD